MKIFLLLFLVFFSQSSWGFHNAQFDLQDEANQLVNCLRREGKLREYNLHPLVIQEKIEDLKKPGSDAIHKIVHEYFLAPYSDFFDLEIQNRNWLLVEKAGMSQQYVQATSQEDYQVIEKNLNSLSDDEFSEIYKKSLIEVLSALEMAAFI